MLGGGGADLIQVVVNNFYVVDQEASFFMCVSAGMPKDFSRKMEWVKGMC